VEDSKTYGVKMTSLLNYIETSTARVALEKTLAQRNSFNFILHLTDQQWLIFTDFLQVVFLKAEILICRPSKQPELNTLAYIQMSSCVLARPIEYKRHVPPNKIDTSLCWEM